MSNQETPPTTKPVVLSMKICPIRFIGHYRIRMGNQVKYLTVDSEVFKKAALKSPVEFFPRLPDSVEWTTANFSRNESNGDLNITISNRTLPGVRCQWHHNLVDCLDLKKIKSLEGIAFEAVHSTSLPKDTVIAKLARFDFELHQFERETKAYQLLEGSGLTRRFLGHITENGRIIGFIVEKTEGRPASFNDLRVCHETLKKLHDFGFLHGAVYHNNFLITEQGVKLLNLELIQENTSQNPKIKEMMHLCSELLNQPGGPGFASHVDIDRCPERELVRRQRWSEKLLLGD